MNEENMMPQLTLSPNSAAQAPVPAAPTLTLEKTPDPAADEAALQAARDAQAIQLDEKQLTDAERQVVDDFSKQIDITDSTQVLQYGAAAQKNIAAFSERALGNVKTKDLGEIGDVLSSLVVELKNFGPQEEEKGGFFGFFQKKKNEVTENAQGGSQPLGWWEELRSWVDE